jgi:hypothetical protein
VAWAHFLGRVKLAVLEYTPHGKHVVKVDDTAPPYVVEGETYRNPGLGFSLTLPKGTEYVNLDAVWPNPTFLTAKVGDQKVLMQEIDVAPVMDLDKREAAVMNIPSLASCKSLVVSGQRGCLVNVPGADVVAFKRGEHSILAVLAVGDKAHETMAKVAKTMHFDDK